MNISIATIAIVLSLTTLVACGEKKNEAAKQTAGPETSVIAEAKVAEKKSEKVAFYQGGDEILLESLDSSDYTILGDIFQGLTNNKPYCPSSDKCNEYVVKWWDIDLQAEPVRSNLDLNAREAYVQSLKGQAPHVQQEITKKAFELRYAQLKELVSTKSICFLYSQWKIEFIDNKYHLSGGNGRHTAVRLNLKMNGNQNVNLLPGIDIYVMSDNKFFAPIPAQQFGDANFKKFSEYAEKPEATRPALKFCGKPESTYTAYMFAVKKANTPVARFDPSAPPAAPAELIAPEIVTSLFRLTKPIEWVQPPSMQKMDSIPMEWFVPAL